MSHITIPPHAVENWLPVPGYDGKYLLSDWGRIRSLYNQSQPIDRFMLPKITPAGYTHYNLYCRGGKPASKCWGAGRLVAMLFVPNPLDLPEIGYLDGNKRNLHYSNIFWTQHNFNVRKSQGYYYSYWHIDQPDAVYYARSRRQVSLVVGMNVSYSLLHREGKPNRKGWVVRMHPLGTQQRFSGFDFYNQFS